MSHSACYSTSQNALVAWGNALSSRSQEGMNPISRSVLHNSYLVCLVQARVWEMQFVMEIVTTGEQHRALIQRRLIFIWPLEGVLKIPCWMCRAEILVGELPQPLRMAVLHNSASAEVRCRLKSPICSETATNKSAHFSNKIWWEHHSGV